MKRSPTIELKAAQLELSAAREACPHWDCESDGQHSECCYRVDDAKHRVKRARARVTS